MAWRRFFSLKHELVGRRHSLRDRMRLFNGVIAPTVLYGCESWTLAVELENKIRRTQRHMLRMIIRTPRRRGEQPDGGQAEHHDFESIDSEGDVDSVVDEAHHIPETAQSTEHLEPW
eukprot:7939770-Pyramimonas_sp.AAC.1